MKKGNGDNGKKAMVLIASAEPGLRKRWASGIQSTAVIHDAGDFGDLERCMAQFSPAVLLLDLDLPQMGGVQGLSKVQRLFPSTRIILLAGKNDETEAVSALKAGAKGYCIREIDPVHLRKAVKVVQKGEVWVGRKTICHLLEELTGLTQNGPNDCLPLQEVYLRHLTPRERQIALLVGEGACNKEISTRLNICERTVKAHLTAIFYKLQITDRLRLGLFVAAQNNGKAINPSIQSPIRPKSNQTKVQLTA